MPQIRKNDLVNFIREGRHSRVVLKKGLNEYYLIVYDKDDTPLIFYENRRTPRTFPTVEQATDWINGKFENLEVSIEE